MISSSKKHNIFIQRKGGCFSYRNSYNLPQKDRTKWYLKKTYALTFNPRYRHHLKTLADDDTNYFSRQKKLSEIVKMPPETQKQFMDQSDNGIVFCQGKDIYYVDDGVIKNISEQARNLLKGILMQNYVLNYD